MSVHALDYALKSEQRSLSGKARGEAPCVVNCLTVQNQSSGYWLAVAASHQSPNETHRAKELNPHAAISFGGSRPEKWLTHRLMWASEVLSGDPVPLASHIWFLTPHELAFVDFTFATIQTDSLQAFGCIFILGWVSVQIWSDFPIGPHICDDATMWGFGST